MHTAGTPETGAQRAPGRLAPAAGGRAHAWDELLLRAVDAAAQDVADAQAQLERGFVHPTLRARVGLDLQESLEEVRKRLEALQRDANSDRPAAENWGELRAARSRLSELIGELLAMLEASLMRERGLGREIMELADGLLAWLSGRLPVEWRRYTILSNREYFGQVAQIVRLRFPEQGIWSLPLAAHELGHYVAPRIGRYELDGTQNFPFRAMLSAVEEDAERGHFAARHLEELFADAFAAYTVGPCFGFACALLRFDPATPLDDGFESHPNDLRRMHAILRALRLPGRADQVDAIDHLEAVWTAAVRQARGTASPLGVRTLRELDGDLDAILDLLVRRLGDGARYRGWSAALILEERLYRGESLLPITMGMGPWDVVNAGWWHRIEREPHNAHALRAHDRQSLDACRELLARGAATEGIAR